MLIDIFGQNVEQIEKAGTAMEEKKDRRVLMTRRMLKETLTEMLHETDIYHVSIRELCQRADINRTTFYKHYGSQFDLLSDMEKDLLDFLSRTITEHAENPAQIIRSSCEYLEEHLDFVRLIINNNVDPLFPQKLLNLAAVREAILSKTAGRPDSGLHEYVFNYITYGAYRILCVWLNKDRREPPEEIADLLLSLIQFE